MTEGEQYPVASSESSTGYSVACVHFSTVVFENRIRPVKFRTNRVFLLRPAAVSDVQIGLANVCGGEPRYFVLFYLLLGGLSSAQQFLNLERVSRIEQKRSILFFFFFFLPLFSFTTRRRGGKCAALRRSGGGACVLLAIAGSSGPRLRPRAPMTTTSCLLARSAAAVRGVVSSFLSRSGKKNARRRRETGKPGQGGRRVVSAESVRGAKRESGKHLRSAENAAALLYRVVFD